MICDERSCLSIHIVIIFGVGIGFHVSPDVSIACPFHETWVLLGKEFYFVSCMAVRKLKAYWLQGQVNS